jgi:hypothetical protein
MKFGVLKPCSQFITAPLEGDEHSSEPFLVCQKLPQPLANGENVICLVTCKFVTLKPEHEIIPVLIW